MGGEVQENEGGDEGKRAIVRLVRAFSKPVKNVRGIDEYLEKELSLRGLPLLIVVLLALHTRGIVKPFLSFTSIPKPPQQPP